MRADTLKGKQKFQLLLL